MKFKTITEYVEFIPFTITIETLREAQVLLSALIIGENRMETFNLLDKTLAKEFIYHLHLKGITEI